MPQVVAFNTPASTFAPVLSGSDFNAPFNVTATFSSDTKGACTDLSYRQYVFGTFAVNSVIVNHWLCQKTNVSLSPSTYLEDGCPPNGSNCTGCTAYGYRQCNMTNDGYFDQSSTSEFWMYDAPGFTNVQPGKTYAVNLNFKGEIVNTKTSTLVQQAKWEVTGQVSIPKSTTTKHLSAAGAHGENPVALAFAKSKEEGPLAILSLRRDAGAPGLNPATIHLRLTDAKGHEIKHGPGVAHEVGNSRRATAHVFYPLPPGALPVKGVVAWEGKAPTELTVD